MARAEATAVVPLLAGWLIWEWFLDDAKVGERDGKDKDTGKVGSNLERRPEGGSR